MHRVPGGIGCTSNAAYAGSKILIELASDYLFVFRLQSPGVSCFGPDPRVRPVPDLRCTRKCRVHVVLLDFVTMRKRFTSIEYTDMIITYGMAGENACAAARMYAERFPGREQYPTRYAIVSCVQRARDTGYILPYQAYRRRRRVKEQERMPRALLDEDLGTGASSKADLFDLSRYKVHPTSLENGLHSQKHQDAYRQLLAADLEERVHFCEGFLAQCRRDLSFPDCILWTDEATITPNGVSSSHNFLYWRGKNPHIVHEDALQYGRWSINVWAGIVANQVIGPCFLPSHLNGRTYANFIENQLPVLLADVPLYVRAKLIFQHDGSPMYFCREVRDVLDTRYPERWMAQGGPISWPTHTPDLSVHNYFIWSYVRGLIEQRRDDKEHEMRKAILAAFHSITPEMAHLSTRNVIQRAELCIREGGQYIERFLR